MKHKMTKAEWQAAEKHYHDIGGKNRIRFFDSIQPNSEDFIIGEIMTMLGIIPVMCLLINIFQTITSLGVLIAIVITYTFNVNIFNIIEYFCDSHLYKKEVICAQDMTLCDMIRAYYSGDDRYYRLVEHGYDSLAQKYQIPEYIIRNICNCRYTAEQEKRIENRYFNHGFHLHDENIITASQDGWASCTIMKVHCQPELSDTFHTQTCKLFISDNPDVSSRIVIDDMPLQDIHTICKADNVYLYPASIGNAIRSCHTDDEGIAKFKHLNAGDYLIVSEHNIVKPITINDDNKQDVYIAGNDGKHYTCQSHIIYMESSPAASIADTGKAKLTIHAYSERYQDVDYSIHQKLRKTPIAEDNILLFKNEIMNQARSDRLIIEANHHVLYDGKLKPEIALDYQEIADALNDFNTEPEHSADDTHELEQNEDKKLASDSTRCVPEENLQVQQLQLSYNEIIQKLQDKVPQKKLKPNKNQ